MKLEARLVVLVLLLNTLSMNSATAQSTPFPVRVGVVLDMDNYVGKMGLNCITMALSDFYTRNGHYRTRLVLNKRDSERDVVGAAAAALDLLKNVEVQAVIGPLSSMQANFMINLGNKSQVPIITFSATSPSLLSIRSPYFVRAALSDSSQVKAIAAIVQAFGWREVVPIYVDNEFGQGIIPYLADALEQVNVRIPYRSTIPSSATDDEIVAELYKLMTMQTRVFIVHMRTTLGSRLFTKAKLLGMMSEDYVWIITDGMTNELASIDRSVMEEDMQGVIGVKPHIPKSEELYNFRVKYRKELHQQNPANHDPDLNIFGLWAYDSAVALAMAVEKARIRNATFLKKANGSTTSTDLEGFGVSGVGTDLIQALSSITFRGLAGDFKLVDGQLQSPPYQIVNVIGARPRVVGYWTKDNGIVRELNFAKSTRNMYSTNKSNIGFIMWPGDGKVPPKGWVIPINGKKLKIGVPVRDGFSEFMHVTWNSNNSTNVEGYCKEVFDMVIEALPYGVQYEYVPFARSDHTKAGSYNELVCAVSQGVSIFSINDLMIQKPHSTHLVCYLFRYITFYSPGQKFDAAVGDVTIVANRTKYVDFTLPYTESGVSMVVAIKNDKSKNAWVFLRPLTWKLWLTSFSSFVFMGFLIWILERRINEDFRGPLWHQVGTIFWFAFSTIAFAHKERVISNLSRFLLILWFLVVLILTQSYTASLTSMLTVQELRPAITDVNELIRNKENVGYHNGSFILGLLKSMNFDESRLVAYNFPEEMDELFRKGSANGGIAAAFDEIPYMKLFQAKYCSKYAMVGPTYKTAGFGFVFPIGSPLVPDISRAILNVTEGKKMMEIEKKWFGNDTKCADSSNISSSGSLGLESFWGLFMIVGIAGALAFVIYVIRFLYENWHVVRRSDADATLGSKSLELFQRFNSKDLTFHAFNNSKRRENQNGCGCDCVRRVMHQPSRRTHQATMAHQVLKRKRTT
ncbi:glutamate receptor 2.7-like isoform X2 [Salvia miltiorrhiza]|uniref:glutamate receptor 2.7-like isoform X2 n=1 Tax=Salvia miltiorrhiza TaxID=226208 RepID=UPI0025AD2480|nr:glutamate receptor 2.7-like isoform X2 [Salvia miltiorrhiza]